MVMKHPFGMDNSCPSVHVFDDRRGGLRDSARMIRGAGILGGP